jgi:6-phosphogluconolactonase (cycloisomerase 2 family)
LKTINGLPISTGGANPVRAVMPSGQRFVYVLNRGASNNTAGSNICTTEYPCLNSNIALFVVGANGILTQQQTFYTQGINPFRLLVDGAGTHLYVLDHDSPAPGSTSSSPIPSSAKNPNTNCSVAVAGSTTCGDITAFSIDQSNGRLTLIANKAATDKLGSTLTYFPVPSDAIDFTFSGSNILTLSGGTNTLASFFPYAYTNSTGQLTVGNSGVQKLSALNATSIVNSGGYIWILDNTPIYSSGTLASESQMWAYQAGTNGSLTSMSASPIADDESQSNPAFLVAEHGGKYFYVANQGNETASISQTGIAGWQINSPFQPSQVTGKPIGFTTGAGPQCLVQDPSFQFFYTANSNDSTVTAQSLDENSGKLVPLVQSTHAPSSYSLTGPATWCFTDSRTN